LGEGRCVPIYNTMWPGPRSTSTPSGILIRPAVWPQYMGQNVGAAVPAFLVVAGSSSNTMSPGARPSSVPSGILIHPAVWPQQTWPKFGGCAPLEESELGPHLTQCGRGKACPHVKFHLDPSNCLATIHQRQSQTGQTDGTDKGPIA